MKIYNQIKLKLSCAHMFCGKCSTGSDQMTVKPTLFSDEWNVSANQKAMQELKQERQDVLQCKEAERGAVRGVGLVYTHLNYLQGSLRQGQSRECQFDRLANFAATYYNPLSFPTTTDHLPNHSSLVANTLSLKKIILCNPGLKS